MNTLAIIILNFKTYKETINCIQSIINTNSRDYSIVVVDNNSGNKSLDIIYDFFKQKITTSYWIDGMPANAQLLLLQSGTNKGYAAGNNIGLRVACELGFKYLCVLNNDCLLLDNSLSILKNTLDDNNEALCVGPLLVKQDCKTIDYNCAKRRPTFFDIIRLSYLQKWLKTEQWQEKYFYLKKCTNLTTPREVHIISGSCMFFDAKKFADLDFFDEKTFLYYEEAILHEKARVRGYKILLNPNAEVIHLGAQTTKAHTETSFLVRCEYNSLRYYLKTYRQFSRLGNILLLSLYSFFLHAFTLKERVAKML